MAHSCTPRPGSALSSSMPPLCYAISEYAVMYEATKSTCPDEVPLNYCALKKKGQKHLCRSGYPLDKKCMPHAKVICPCVAKKHHLKVSGRRNMLGTISGRRRCEWVSGTNRLTAAMLRSNTHFQPNFRIPLTSETTECKGACLPGLQDSAASQKEVHRLFD